MTKIKLIVLDMDETACSFHQGIHEANIMPIIKAQEMGVRVIFCNRTTSINFVIRTY